MTEFEKVFLKRFGKMPTYQGNEFTDNIIARRTIREFTNEPLEPGLLEYLVAVAQSSATSGMLQSWSVIALTTREEKENLIKSNPSCFGDYNDNSSPIYQSSVYLVWLADLHRNRSLLEQTDRNIDSGYFDLFDQAEYQLKGIVDASIAAQTFAIAAESLGLGVMYNGGLRQIGTENFQKVFNLPKYTYPLFGMAVGYSAEQDGKVRPRFNQETVLHYGKYQPVDASSKDIEYFNTRHRREIKTQVMQDSDQVDRIMERMELNSYNKNSVGKSLRDLGFIFK